MRSLGLRAQSRVLILVLSTFLIPFAGFSQSASQETQPAALAGNRSVPAIVIGFIGGPIPHKVRLYAELAARLREEDGDRIRVEIENNGLRDRKKANSRHETFAELGWTPTETASSRTPRSTTLASYSSATALAERRPLLSPAICSGKTSPFFSRSKLIASPSLGRATV